jgi:hypothetical protein
MTMPSNHEVPDQAIAWGEGFDARMANKYVNPYDHFKQFELSAAWLSGFQYASLVLKNNDTANFKGVDDAKEIKS